MDKRIINQKLENLRRCIGRIESKMPKTAEVLVQDFDIQDIVSINIERAVQSCLDIAAHLLADFDDLGELSSASLFLELAHRNFIDPDLAGKLAKAAGFRNLLVHPYASIDWLKVYEVITNELDIFRQFGAQIDSLP